MKLEHANSRALNFQYEEYKKVIIKLGVNPEDKTIIKALFESKEYEVQSLRRKLKLSIAEHVQTLELV